MLRIDVHVAAADDFAPPTRIAEWLRAAEDASVDARVFTYPRAGHFYTDATLSDYDELASALIRQRVLDFLQLLNGEIDAGARIEGRLPTQDLPRARRWYAEKLGLEAVEERPNALRYAGATGVFCLFSSAGASHGSFTPVGLHVDDIETAVAELRARGVVFEEYEGTVNGIMSLEGNYPGKARGERAAWFRDSEGNLLGIPDVVR